MLKKKLYISNNLIQFIHVIKHIKLFSRCSSSSAINNNDKSKEIIYDKKRIIEIINSIKNTDNYKFAFTHSSYRKNNTDKECYERLEFFGDSLIEYYTTHLLFKCYPKHSEGGLTNIRSSMVKRENLSKISKQIGLDKLVMLDVNIEKSNKILADIFESFIAALYLEKGEDILHEFLSLTLFNRIEIKDFLKNYKSDRIGLPLEINMNKENNMLSNSMSKGVREITFKFPNELNEDVEKNKLFNEQNVILKKISSVNDGIYNFLNNILKNKLSSFCDGYSLDNKELINIIRCFMDNLNSKYHQNKLINDNINKELTSNNNYLKELNNNVLNINNNIDLLLSKLNYKLSIIILILTLSMIIICVLLIYILSSNIS
jgi:dsRNA-specific ribonuclease